MDAMLSASMLCSAVVVWFAVCVLLVVMWFPIEPKTKDQLFRRRVAAAALFAAWLFVGKLFYQYAGLYVNFF